MFQKRTMIGIDGGAVKYKWEAVGYMLKLYCQNVHRDDMILSLKPRLTPIMKVR